MNDIKFDYHEFWKATYENIKNNSPENEYNTWFSRISYYASEPQQVILAVPSQFICDKVTKLYKVMIVNTLSELAGEEIKVQFIVKKLSEQQTKDVKNENPVPEQTQQQFESNSLNKARENANINPDYQFSNFIIGENSTFAYNASLAIAKNPGTSLNPCLIYGGVGLGKTHLINAIGNYILENQKDLKVVYITAEAFTNEFIEALGSKKTQQFKNKFRKVDVLLIDDIHFLQNKDQTQEEIFHTFNDLYEAKKQMVFTCDRPINELKGMTDRLISRFERGLNVDLQPPSYETRVAILRNKCKMHNKSMNSDIIDYIAQNVSSNVRDLEASLTKLIAYSELLNQELTLSKAKELLSVMPFVKSGSVEEGLSIQSIIKTICNYFNVSLTDLKSKKKNKSLIQPRQIAMYLSKDMTSFSLTEIGSEFGNRDHTTVMHACERINSLMSVNADTKTLIEKLKREIKNSK
ncbi:MAG: chromosomal replication initiator protein DnaA [Sphaerochaetaceae bacterium]